MTRWRKNKGLNKIRNGITLCYDAHQGFHKGDNDLKFGDVNNLPPHIRGRTFKVHLENKVNWKKVKSEMKQLRKNLKNVCGLKLSWAEINILMKFLEMNFNEEDD